MKNWTKWIWAGLFVSTLALAVGKIQNEDVKSLTDLQSAGGSTSQLINDTKIYDTTNAQQLSQSIAGGVLGGGSGGVNYLTNGSFELGTTQTGWTEASGTFTNETSTIYAGQKSVKIVASSQTSTLTQDVTPTQNTNGISMEASCKINSTFVNVQVCARTGGSNGQCVNASTSGSWGQTTVNFIGPSNGTSVGVRVQMSTSGSGTIYVDDCYVGPARNISNGTFTTLETAFTPTGSWSTNTTYTGFYRRNGGSADIQYYIALSGAPTSASLTLNLPTGLTIDTTRLTNSGTNFVFNGSVNGNSAAHSFIGQALFNSSSSFAVKYTTDGSTASNMSLASVTQAAPYTFANGDFISVQVLGVPIASYTDVPIYTPDKTPASWSGYHTSGGATWSRTNTSYGDPTVSGSESLVEVANRNFGTVSTAASHLAGITFTPPRAGRYWACANVTFAVDTQNSFGAVSLTDGTTVIAEINQRGAIANAYSTMPACGLYNYSGSGAITLKLQTKDSSGAIQIGSNSLGARSSIEWSIVELDTPFSTPFLTQKASWSGYIGGITGGGTTSSATYADPSTSTGSPALTQIYNNGMGTVSLLNSSNLGITLTFPTAGPYQICANVSIGGPSGTIMGARLVDGSSTVINPGTTFTPNVTGSGNNAITNMVCGIYNAAAASTNIKVQMAVQSAAHTGGIVSTASMATTGDAQVMWTIQQL